MEPKTILKSLKYLGNSFPREALEAAIAQRKPVTPYLLEALEDATRTLDQLTLDETYMLPIYAFYLLAQFREKRAYPLIVNFFAIPGEAVLDLTGDFVTEDLGQVLASVSGGDMTLMKRLAEDPQVNDYVRSAALKGMLTLFVEGIVSREELIAYFQSCFDGGLERADPFAWGSLISKCTAIYPEELMPQIRQAYADDLVDEFYIDLPWVEEVLERGKPAALARLHKDHHYHFVNDSVAYLARMPWWDEVQPTPSFVPASPGKKPGRNDPCPCGSGKKYKHCCGRPQS